MKDIYGRTIPLSGVWRSADAVLDIEGSRDIIITGFNVNYNRETNPFTALNKRGRILMVGDGIGNMSMSAIVGPTSQIREFFQKYADPCAAMENAISIMAASFEDCEDTGYDPTGFIASGLFINAFSGSVTRIGNITAVTGNMGFFVNSLGFAGSQ